MIVVLEVEEQQHSVLKEHADGSRENLDEFLVKLGKITFRSSSFTQIAQLKPYFYSSFVQNSNKEKIVVKYAAGIIFTFTFRLLF